VSSSAAIDRRSRLVSSVITRSSMVIEP
jgi:hypothetical protein